MATARDLISRAFRNAQILGQGQTLAAEDVDEGFELLNDMMAEWTVKRWLCYQLVDVAFVCTGAQRYSVGPASNFVFAERPDRLEAAYIRQLVTAVPNQIDYPLELIQSYEDYSRIALKSLVSQPDSIFYLTSYPVGYLYPYPVPTSAIYELHALFKTALQDFTNLSTSIAIPRVYRQAILWNMAYRLREEYGQPETPACTKLAKSTLKALRMANIQVPRLIMPTGLTRGSIYNIYSDQSY